MFDTQEMTRAEEVDFDIRRAKVNFIPRFFSDLFRYFDRELHYDGFDYPSSEYFTAKEISINDAGLTVISQNQEGREKVPCRVRIPKVETMQNYLVMMSGMLSQDIELEEYFHEISESDTTYLEFDVMIKDFEFDPMLERIGYERLSELGVQTFTCIFPNDQIIYSNLSQDIRDEGSVITLIESGLRPLSSMEEDKIYRVANGSSIISNVFDILTTLHTSNVIHGDTSFKNWGYKSGKGVFLFDTEGLIDFNKLAFYRKRDRSNRMNKPDEMLWEESVITDLRRVLISLIDKHTLIIPDEHQPEIRNQLYNYIKAMRETRSMSDNLLDHALAMFSEYLDTSTLVEQF